MACLILSMPSRYMGQLGQFDAGSRFFIIENRWKELTPLARRDSESQARWRSKLQRRAQDPIAPPKTTVRARDIRRL